MNPQWKGGIRKHGDGYIIEYAPNHSHAINGGVLQHRLVMEKKIGRYLISEEVVHHINGDRADNRIENLQLTNRVEHGRIHQPRIMKTCVWCRKEFFRKENPYLRNNGWGKTCSRSCGAHLRWSNK